MVKKKKNKTSGNLYNAHQLLFTSVKKGDLAGVLKAIEDGAEVEPARMKAQFKRKKSPLFLAVQFDHVNIIPPLIEVKAKIDNESISLAFRRENYDMVHVLLSECKATQLLGEWYLNAIDLGWLDIVELLAERRCPMNALDKMDNTPLHCTIMKGDYKRSKLLLDARADVSSTNSWGETPLHLAIKRVPMLARTVIAQKCQLDSQDREGLHPLHLAFIHDMPDVAKLLIETSCDVNCSDKKGRTPLFLVLTASWTSHVHHSQVSLVKLLLKSNSAVDRSILETAIKNDASKIVSIFLDVTDELSDLSGDEMTDLSGLVKLAQEYCSEIESPLRQLEVQRALEDYNVQVFPPRIASVIARWSWKMEKLDIQQTEIQAKLDTQKAEMKAKLDIERAQMQQKLRDMKNISNNQRDAQRGRPGRGRYSAGRGFLNNNSAGTGRSRGNGRIAPNSTGRPRGNSRIQERGVRRGGYKSRGDLRKIQAGNRGQRNSPSSGDPSYVEPHRGDGLSEKSSSSGVTLQFAKTMLYKSLTVPKPPVRGVYRALRTFERVKPPTQLPDNTLKVAIGSRAGSLVIRALLNAGAPLTFSAMSEAVMRSRTDVLKIFFASDKFDVNIKGPDGNTLFDVARVHGRSAVTKMLENAKK